MVLLRNYSGSLLQFKNCKLLRNHQLIEEDLWVRNGKIINPEPVYFDERLIADAVIDCNGFTLAPGFIDVQINGAFGIDFTHDADKIEEGILRVAKEVLAHGVTSFCPTIITSSAETYRQILPKIRKQPGGFGGAGILGVHLEGPFINLEKCGAHPKELIRNFNNGFDDLLATYGCLDNVSIVTLAPELPNACRITSELMKSGITVSVGHSIGTLDAGEKAVQAGARFITHLFNAMLPFHHRDPGLVGLLASDLVTHNHNIYFGIIADGIHTHPAALRIAHRTHPTGLVLVTDAIALMGLPAGRHYIGQQSVEIKGNKAIIVGTDTLCGSIATMNDCVQHFMKATGCSKVEALEAASLHPAQALGISHRKGTLNFNSEADFILVDDNLKVLSTFIGGDCVWTSPNLNPPFTVLKN